MGAITSMALQAAIILALEYIIYKWLLSSSTFFRINRTIIMCCYLLAVILTPLMGFFSRWYNSLFHYGVVVFGPMELTGVSETAQGANSFSSFSLWHWVPIIYIIGVAVTAIVMLVSYIRLFNIIRKGKKIVREDCTLVLSDSEIAPYSWGKYIVISQEDVDNRMIVSHEVAHIRLHHSLELIIANLFVIFNWFNPAAYLMRRELSSVQEYEADEKVLEGKDVSVKDYQILLIKKVTGSRFHAISNYLSHRQLKLRLCMMMRSKSNPLRILAAVLLLPALIGAVAITSTPVVASVIGTVGKLSYNKGSDSDTNKQQSQLKVINLDPISTPEVYDQPEVLPQFEEGDAVLYRTLAMEMRYPEDAQEEGQQGKVLVKFDIYPDGKASNFEVAKSSGHESLDNEALRVCKENLTEGWIPGKNNGEVVTCTYSLPVVFRLN